MDKLLKSNLGRLWRWGFVPAILATVGCMPVDGMDVATDGDEEIAETFESFEDFEAKTFREAETGLYIVDGDIPIDGIDALRDFWEQHVRDGALIVHQSNGVDAKWSDAEKTTLTYCVSTSFGTRWQSVADAMRAAGTAWAQSGNVRFVHLTEQDGACTATNTRVVFDVRPVSGQSYLARAFFPDSTRANRSVLIDSSSFGNIGVYTLPGILRHELGHTLGFRHEHTRPNAATCFENNSWRDLGSYDSSSVMHYPQCNGTQNGDLVLTEKDKLGVGALYGRRYGGAENLAYRKTATQSSVGHAWGGAGNAVDGDPDGNFAHRTVTHTSNELTPWWQVDLGSVQSVGEVVLHNRTDCCSERLSAFKVSVSKDGATWSTQSYPGRAGEQQGFSFNQEARYVKVQLDNTGTTRPLSLAEVEVFATRNLSRRKTATQSSVANNGVASRAVDGNTNGNWYSNSVTHTAGELSPWWQVDLGALQPVGDVVLYNRTDCCSERLTNFKVLVSADGVTWSEKAFPGQAGVLERISMNRLARYVRVQLENTGVNRILSLAEVAVMAARNLALGGTATQSSNYLGGIPARAIDGTTDGLWLDGSTTHTGFELSPWWQVDLGGVMPVGEVALYNRVDCCSERLSNFKMLTSEDGQAWDVLDYPGTAGARVSFPINKPTRYVKVQLNDTGVTRPLSLAEVEVMAARNLALAGSATQSSLWENGVASLAIDGNTDGDYFTGKSVQHTNSDPQAWWQVDLGSLQPINEVKVYNRTDGPTNPLRLSNFKVMVSEDAQTWKEFQFPGTAGVRESFATSRMGRYVKVQLNGTNFLHMAEVEVYNWN